MGKRFCFAACLILMMIASVAACRAEETLYYVNPHGGRLYHAIAQCPSMDEKYWDGVIAVSQTQLDLPEYQALLKCEICFEDEEPRPSPHPYGDVKVFFNIMEGTVFHAGEDCPAITDEERELIYETSYETLIGSPYCTRVPCTVCFSEQERKRFVQ